MSVAKTIELSAESPNGFEEAIRLGIDRARKTVENIQGAWVNEQQVVVDGGVITAYRVNLKITFLLK